MQAKEALRKTFLQAEQIADVSALAESLGHTLGRFAPRGEGNLIATCRFCFCDAVIEQEQIFGRATALACRAH